MNPQPDTRRWNLNWLLGLFLVAAIILAYQPVWHAGFIWDDDAYVTHNVLLTAPDGLQRIWFSTDSPSQYFPLVYTTFRLEHALWGLNPAGYHWVNILMHAVNALLAWRLLQRLCVPGAWLAAAIFALHPVNVESVAWIAELKNVQSLAFALLALLAWVEFLEQPSRWRWYGLAVAFYVLALFSKTTACTLPVALVLILWLKRKPISRFRLAQIFPFVLCGIAMGLVSIWWERHHQGTAGKVFSFGLLERVLIASRAAWFYFGKLVWPADLIFIYPSWQINPAAPLAYVWLLAGAGLAATIYFVRRFVGRSVEVAVVYFLATLSPMLGFVMLYTFQYKFVADHYQYMASLGPIALVAAGLNTWSFELAKSSWLKPIFCGALLAVLGVLTWRQCGMYSDLETLWRRTLVKNPQSFMVLNNLGEVLVEKGRLDEAIGYFRQTLKIKPDSAKAHCNLGAALFQNGQVDGAVRQFLEALEIQPDLAEAHKNLSDVFIRLGRVEDALFHSQRAVEIKPEFPEALNNLGNALLQKGKLDEAIIQLEKALAFFPDYPNALNNIGVALVQKGRTAEALALFQKTVDLQPDFAEAHNNLGKLQLLKNKAKEALAHYETALKTQPDDPYTLANLAWVLATAPEAALRNGSTAVELAQRAHELSGGQSPVIMGTLAAAYAEVGRFAEAVISVERALQLAKAQSSLSPSQVDLLKAQLKLHQNNAPFRDNGQAADPAEPGHSHPSP